MVEAFKTGQSKTAMVAMVEELFNDYWAHRRQVYRMNFVRGLMFGLGSALGGTVVLALAVWLLTQLLSLPLVGGYVQDVKNSINQSLQQRR